MFASVIQTIRQAQWRLSRMVAACLLASIVTPALVQGSVRIAPNPVEVQFGSNTIGTTTDLPCTITSTATQNIQIDTMFLDGANPTDFLIVSPTQRSFLLGAADHRDLLLGFQPQAAGVRSAILRILTSDGELDIPLSGTGDNTQPNVSMVPSTVDFGPLSPGSVKDTLLHLIAQGPDSATVSDLAVQNPNGAIYYTARLADAALQLPIRLGPGDSLGIIAEFSSSAPLGAKVGSVTAEGEVLGNSTCTFTGNVVEPDILISPTVIDYGIVTRGSVIDTTVTIYSTGLVPLQIDDIEPLTNGWSFLNPFPTIPLLLQPSESVVLHVRFAPTDTGKFSYNLGLLAHETSNGGNFRSIHLMATVRDIPLTVTGTDLRYFCAFDSTISGAVDAGNSGPVPLDITGYTSTDSLVTIKSAFPVTIGAGQTIRLLVSHAATNDTNSTVTINLVSGGTVMKSVVLALQQLQVGGTSGSMLTKLDTLQLKEQRQTIVNSQVGQVPIDQIIVTLRLTDPDLATIDPQSLVLNPVTLPGATIAGIAPVTGGLEITISTPNGLDLAGISAANSWLVRYELQAFVALQTQSELVTDVRLPELVGCMDITSDTTAIGVPSYCGDPLVRSKLADAPLIDQFTIADNPVTHASTTLRLHLSAPALITVTCYDDMGRAVSSTFRRPVERGASQLPLDLSALPTGSYVLRVAAETATGEIAVRSMTVVKLN